MQIRPQNSVLAEFTQELARRNGNTATDGSLVEGPGDFGSFLASGIKKVNDAQANSQSQIESMLSGEDVDTAEVITSIQKADMAFQLLVQVRNKLMKAYEEIQSIQI